MTGMMHVARGLLLMAIATAAAGADEKFDPRKEGVVVIGLQPDTIAVFIGEGKLSGERRWKSTQGFATFSGPSKDGYIVTRVRANTVMAFRSVRLVDHSRPQHWFCGTSFTPTFTVAPGKVLYLGEFTYRWPEGLDPWLLTNDADIDRARRYVDAHFTWLSGKMEPGTFTLMRTRTNCSAKNGSLSYP